MSIYSIMDISSHYCSKAERVHRALTKKNILDPDQRTLAADFGMMAFNDPKATDAYRKRLTEFMEQNVRGGGVHATDEANNPDP